MSPRDHEVSLILASDSAAAGESTSKDHRRREEQVNNHYGNVPPVPLRLAMPILVEWPDVQFLERRRKPSEYAIATMARLFRMIVDPDDWALNDIKPQKIITTVWLPYIDMQQAYEIWVQDVSPKRPRLQNICR